MLGLNLHPCNIQQNEQSTLTDPKKREKTTTYGIGHMWYGALPVNGITTPLPS